jgi:DNA-binding transcriptional LysR family regulator
MQNAMSLSHYNLLSLRLFISTIDCRSIAGAAKANNIAASAVSKRISDMEASTRVGLLQRRRDGVEPTPAGQALYRQARLVCDMLTRLDAELSDYADGAQGVVRMSANSSAITQFLPDDIAAFNSRFPNVRFDLHESTSARSVNAVLNGSADLAVFSEHVAHDTLLTRAYRRDKLMVVMPKEHPLSTYTRVTLAQTLAYDHVGLQDDSSLQARIRSAADLLDQSVRIRVNVLSFEGVRRMIEAGLGISILPEGVVLPYLGSANVAAVELDEKWAARTLLVGYRNVASLTQTCRYLIDFLAPDK